MVVSLLANRPQAARLAFLSSETKGRVQVQAHQHLLGEHFCSFQRWLGLNWDALHVVLAGQDVRHGIRLSRFPADFSWLGALGMFQDHTGAFQGLA